MASSGKKKTTMAKLARESRLRERRQEKKARKEARKFAAANPPSPEEQFIDGEPVEAHEAEGDAGVAPAEANEPLAR
jgi:hypothetical protein